MRSRAGHYDLPTTATIGQKPLWEEQVRTSSQTVFRVAIYPNVQGAIVHLVLQKIAHTSRARRKLPRDIFRRIAQSAQLQHQLLEVLANRPETQLNVVVELEETPNCSEGSWCLRVSRPIIVDDASPGSAKS